MEYEEVQKGWQGRIIPFDIVQRTLLKNDFEKIVAKQNRVAEIQSKYEEFIESLDEDEKQELLNDDNTEIDKKKIQDKLNEIYSEIKGIGILQKYLQLNKAEKIKYVADNKNVNWEDMEISKNGTYSKQAITQYQEKLKSNVKFDEDSIEYRVKEIESLVNEEKQLNSELKSDEKILLAKTKDTIESLSDNQIILLLNLKWITPLADALNNMPANIINNLTAKINHIEQKYKTTLSQVEKQINESEDILSSMIDDLQGDEYDKKGITMLKSLLKKNK